MSGGQSKADPRRSVADGFTSTATPSASSGVSSTVLWGFPLAVQLQHPTPDMSEAPATPDLAVATLLTDDSYLPGALTCIHSVLDADQSASVQRQYETICLVTPASVSVEAIKLLKQHFDRVEYCEAIQSSSPKELALLGRPELKNTLTKLHLFRYTQYKRILYLDADTLAVQSMSHLFAIDTPHPVSAAPDVGWPDAFNSGVLLLSPDQQHFDGLMAMAQDKGSWDGGDQGLLNDYFENNWNRISFTHNVTPSAYYQYEPAMRRYGHDVKLVHFIGQDKPWNHLHRTRAQPASSELSAAPTYERLLGNWFDTYERHFGQQSTASLLTPSLGSKPQAAVEVPKYDNRWDQPQETTSFTPKDPNELKDMFARNSQILAQYASFGFTPGSDYQGAPSSPAPHVAPPQQEEPRRPSPPMLPWDATREEADKTRLQMAQPMQHHYDNAWDTSTRESRQFFKAPKEEHQIPVNVRNEYFAVTNAKSKAPTTSVFPWEQNARPRPTRVFPDSPSRASPTSSSSSNASNTPKAAPSNLPYNRQSLEASVNSAPATALGGLPKDLGYTNAWDNIRGIRRYVNALEDDLPSRERAVNEAGEPESSMAHHLEPRRRTKSESSSSSSFGDDGDDEADDDADEATARIVASMKRFSFHPSKGHPGTKLAVRVPNSKDWVKKSPVQRSVPLPTPDVEPSQMRGNIMSVHKRRISLTDQGSSSSRNRKKRSPLPSPGLAPSAHGKMLPNPTAKRVFHPSTDTSIIRKEGEAAYNRYMDIMETRGQQEEAREQALPTSSSPLLRPSP